MSDPHRPSAAFFDLDNTLLHGSSLYVVGRAMHARGLVSTRDALRGAWQQLVFRVAGERSGLVQKVRDRSLARGAGVEVAPFLALGEAIYDEWFAGRILAETLALAQRHLDRGDDVWIVTASPVELARIVASRLGFTGALGTVSEVEDGRWTGRIVGDFLHGAGKADAVRRLAAERGYVLADCDAYSDSANDLPLLRAVGHPHAVNPDGKLRDEARRQGWPVHDFRLRRHRREAALATVATAAVAVGYALTRGARHPQADRSLIHS